MATTDIRNHNGSGNKSGDQKIEAQNNDAKTTEKITEKITAKATLKTTGESQSTKIIRDGGASVGRVVALTTFDQPAETGDAPVPAAAAKPVPTAPVSEVSPVARREEPAKTPPRPEAVPAIKSTKISVGKSPAIKSPAGKSKNPTPVRPAARSTVSAVAATPPPAAPAVKSQSTTPLRPAARSTVSAVAATPPPAAPAVKPPAGKSKSKTPVRSAKPAVSPAAVLVRNFGDLNDRMTGYALRRMRSGIDFSRSLLQVRTPTDAVSLYSEFVRDALGDFLSEARGLTTVGRAGAATKTSGNT